MRIDWVWVKLCLRMQGFRPMVEHRVHPAIDQVMPLPIPFRFHWAPLGAAAYGIRRPL